jgi:hypothetical protein
MDRDGGPQILLQRSSGEIASTATGSYGVIPSLSTSPASEVENWSLLELNILREVAEELFGVEELETGAGEERLDPAWFIRMLPISHIADDLASRATRLRYLSSGFEGLNGTYEIHVALEIEAASETARSLADAVGNWEVAHEDGTKSLLSIPLYSPEIDEWYEEGRLAIGTAVAIAQLRKHLSRNGGATA